jgi:hypothetical protein
MEAALASTTHLDETLITSISNEEGRHVASAYSSYRSEFNMISRTLGVHAADAVELKADTRMASEDGLDRYHGSDGGRAAGDEHKFA